MCMTSESDQVNTPISYSAPGFQVRAGVPGELQRALAPCLFVWPGTLVAEWEGR